MTKNFFALFVTQFCGALNDNIFKNALVILITFKEATVLGMGPASIVALAGGIFILPFFLFSAWAGQLADCHQRTNLARYVKWAELLIMLICSYGFMSHHFEFLLLGLFLMGLHSTFFGPIKYSMIPDLVDEANLNAANAYVEAGTFAAILIGTIIGGVTAAMSGQEWAIVVTLITFSLVGLLASYKIPLVKIADPDLQLSHNPFPQTWRMLKLAHETPIVFRNILGISWFWFLGATVLSILPVYIKNHLHGSETVVTLFLTVFTVGIALGSGLSTTFIHKFALRKVVQTGGFFITLGLLDWAWLTHTNSTNPYSWRLIVDLLFVAIGGGLFTVPQTTSMQRNSVRAHLSRVVAANNIMNALFMVVASLLLTTLYAFKLNFAQIFIVIGVMNFISSWWASREL